MWRVVWNIVEEVEPKAGRLRIQGTDYKATIAFADHGLECLQDISREHKRVK